MPLPGNLKCNNNKCGHIFPVTDFRSDTPIACPRCGERSQYRLADLRADNVTFAVLCQRVADDHSIDEATRRKAAKLKSEWVKLEAKRKALVNYVLGRGGTRRGRAVE